MGVIKCSKCHNSLDDYDFKTCINCRDKSKIEAQKRRQISKSKGLCQDCCKRKVKNKDGIYCDLCLGKQKENRDFLVLKCICIYCKKHSQKSICDECREKYRLKAKERRKRWKEEGLCIKCGSIKNNNYSKCDKCRTNIKNLYKENTAHRLKSGLCVRCSDLAIPNNRVCYKCYLKERSVRIFGTRVYWENLGNLFEKQNGICPYTGKKLVIGQNAEIDHVVPKDKGGSNEIENLQWVLSEINQMKWNYMEDNFLDIVSKVYEYRNLKPYERS